MNDKTVVHVVDDDAAMRDSMAFLLDVNGFKPRVYNSASAFLAESPIDALSCVVSDIRMPGMNGIELVHELKSKGSTSPVILITGHGDVALAVEAMKAGAADFIEKPFDDAVLLGAIRSALERPAGNSRRQLGENGGRSTAGRAISARARRPAGTGGGKDKQGNRARSRHQPAHG